MRLLKSFPLAMALLSAPAFAADADVEHRLRALEDRIEVLEKENKALTERLNVENKRAAQAVRADVAPTIGDAEGNFSFKARGLINADAVPDRLRPLRNFSPARGDWGALELLLRYDWFDFSDTPVVARRGNKGHSLTGGFTWYYNPNMKLMVNWVRFAGTNTPLDPVGNRTAGDAIAARAHVDF